MEYYIVLHKGLNIGGKKQTNLKAECNNSECGAQHKINIQENVTKKKKP